MDFLEKVNENMKKYILFFDYCIFVFDSFFKQDSTIILMNNETEVFEDKSRISF